MTLRRAVAERTRGRAPALVALAALALACGGGGGGGGPIGPDVTPPGVPVSSLILVEPPIPGSIARLSGRGGAVENSATVQLSNSSAAQRTGQPVTATAQAGADGTFAVSIPAQLGDQLALTAADAAGNVSGALSLTAGPTPTTLSVVDTGDEQLITLTTGEGAFNLPFTGGGERFTLVVQALNPGSGSFPVSVSGSQEVAVRALRSSALPESGDGTLEAELRAAERRALAGLPSRPVLPSGARRLAPSDDPLIGSTRTFDVVNRISGFSLTTRGHFDIVTARLLYKGEHTLIYVDERVPAQDVPDVLIQSTGDRFDQQTYHIDRGAFGNESDVDANNRVIVLMTATVNALNTEATIETGILTGFFFAIDLVDQPFVPFGNDAEIFYTLAPDPDKEFGAAVVPVDGLMESLHAILAHEFEHMINAAARIETASLEEVWLDEGLAHYAETLNDVEEGDIQNVLRAGLYLQEPQAWSLIGGQSAPLEQRGAAWLLVMYLADHEGPALIRELVQSGLIGTHNIEVSADTSFSFLFHLFSSALFLDGQGITGESVFEFSSIDVRSLFQEAKARFATFSPPRFLGSFLDLRTASVPGGNLSSVNVKGSSPAYFEVSSSQTATVPILVQADRQSNLQVTIIRTQ